MDAERPRCTAEDEHRSAPQAVHEAAALLVPRRSVWASALHPDVVLPLVAVLLVLTLLAAWVA